MNTRVATIGEMDAAAEHFLSAIPESTTATVVALYGELGAGKTTFVKSVARALGVEEDITSPTFVIEKLYAIPPKSNALFATLVHIDAYRLTEARELTVLQFDALLKNNKNLICIEWAENVLDILPTDTLHVRFTLVSDTVRDIEYETN